MYQFYGYPKCSTCQKAKAMLNRLEIKYQEIDIKENPPEAKTFEKWFKEGNFLPKQFFNTSGLVYREMGLKDRLSELSLKEQAHLLASNGMLVKRPLLIKDNQLIAIGFKEAVYAQL